MNNNLENEDKGFSGLSSMVSKIEPISIEEDVLNEGVQKEADNEDANEHESINPGPQQISRQRSVSKVINICVVAFVVLIGLIYLYQTYNKTNNPEETVKIFYRAYFGRDYKTVADNLSVFWSVRFLPEYADKEPAELLAARPQIVNSITGVIEEIENENSIPEDVEISIKRQYTRKGQTSAIVAYEFKQRGQPTSMEAAVLIMEDGKFRVFNMSAIDETVLPEIKSMDMQILDDNFNELLSSGDLPAE